MWQVQAKVLQMSLANVKKRLGGICPHLSYCKMKIEEGGVWKEVDAVKAVMYNSNGGRDTVTIRVRSNKDGINYEELFQLLKKEAYVG